jgi:hypothetical protein
MTLADLSLDCIGRSSQSVYDTYVVYRMNRMIEYIGIHAIPTPVVLDELLVAW